MTGLGLRIGIDFTGFEDLSSGNGQFRYLVSLAKGLAPRLSPGEGWLFSPASRLRDELRPYCAPTGPFRYESVVSLGRCEPVSLTHIYRSALAKVLRLDVLHAVHAFLPMMSPCATVMTIHDLMPELFPEYQTWVRSRAYRYYRYFARERANALVCVSETTAEDVRLRWGVARDRVFTTPLAATSFPQEDAPLPRAVPGTGRWILSPYNLEPRKNLYRLVEAFAEVAGFMDDVSLVLFGRAAHTPERELKFEDQVARLSLGHKVIRTGFVSDAVLSTMYRRCTLFVFPSLYEGFGLPVLEAMAHGACVVVGDRSAMREVAGDAGVLMDVDSPSQMATTIARSLQDERRCESLREKARTRSSAFSVERLADHTIEAYRFASRRFTSGTRERSYQAVK
jgi:glycosyltransferase involved in cell wall biosynthesis